MQKGKKIIRRGIIMIGKAQPVKKFGIQLVDLASGKYAYITLGFVSKKVTLKSLRAEIVKRLNE